MKPYRKFRTKDIDLSRVQDRVDDAITPILTNPLIGGIFIEVSFPSAGTVDITHRLGRQPLGWVITDITAAASIHRVSWDSKTLTLESSAVTSIKLYLF